ncbi:hypothetical protein VKT23_010313 [Stygiomarasmius scandens]|uniref:Uncharacterized protein n=1 Tax=Marasmiellus scandens TaxID=2682957 RepID=A0ABR1JG10_9AGAR
MNDADFIPLLESILGAIFHPETLKPNISFISSSLQPSFLSRIAAIGSGNPIEASLSNRFTIAFPKAIWSLAYALLRESSLEDVQEAEKNQTLALDTASFWFSQATEDMLQNFLSDTRSLTTAYTTSTRTCAVAALALLKLGQLCALQDSRNNISDKLREALSLPVLEQKSALLDVLLELCKDRDVVKIYNIFDELYAVAHHNGTLDKSYFVGLTSIMQADGANGGYLHNELARGMIHVLGDFLHEYVDLDLNLEQYKFLETFEAFYKKISIHGFTLQQSASLYHTETALTKPLQKLAAYEHASSTTDLLFLKSLDHFYWDETWANGKDSPIPQRTRDCIRGYYLKSFDPVAICKADTFHHLETCILADISGDEEQLHDSHFHAARILFHSLHKCDNEEHGMYPPGKKPRGRFQVFVTRVFEKIRVRSCPDFSGYLSKLTGKPVIYSMVGTTTDAMLCQDMMAATGLYRHEGKEPEEILVRYIRMLGWEAGFQDVYLPQRSDSKGLNDYATSVKSLYVRALTQHLSLFERIRDAESAPYKKSCFEDLRMITGSYNGLGSVYEPIQVLFAKQVSDLLTPIHGDEDNESGARPNELQSKLYDVLVRFSHCDRWITSPEAAESLLKQ